MNAAASFPLRSGHHGSPLPTGPRIDPVVASSGLMMAQAFRMPFDMVRSHYARAAEVGLFEKSMLRNRDFELALGSLECVTLGPWARHR